MSTPIPIMTEFELYAARYHYRWEHLDAVLNNKPNSRELRYKLERIEREIEKRRGLWGYLSRYTRRYR